ncbi:MAG TPA: helix-turn-helix domain-containing protein [Gemmataceae bacterium]|nr:helix-turn-helix domain-containing protein [Gemmataceae bacterium]
MQANETLGQKLQRLRLTAGLTQVQLAEAAGVPLSTLRGWEVDRREPGLRAAARLAKALGVTAEDLADTVPIDEAGKSPRPAGPSRRTQTPDADAPPSATTKPATGKTTAKKPRKRKGE